MFGMQEADDMLNPNKHEEWKKALERTLRYFEPRVVRPKVTILNVNPSQQSIDIEIKGNILINAHLKRIHFPFVVRNPY
jgi:predicted component of type VI protein secretion system